MLYFFCRKFAVLLLAGLVTATLTGCFAAKQKVEPYPERGQPVSVAKVIEPQVEKPGASAGPAQEEMGDVPGEGGLLQGAARTVQPEVLLPVLTEVNDRIVAYEEKLRAWEDLRDEAEKINQDQELKDKISVCQRQLQGILASYNQVHEQLIKKGPAQSLDAVTMEQLQNIAREDIGFLESECQRITASGQQAGDLLAGTTAKLLVEGEKTIAMAMAANDYSQVITLFQQLPAAGGLKPSFATVDSYGQALLRSGREQEASQVFNGLLQDIQQQNQVGREFQLMQLVADIQFGREEYSDAFAQYVNIINKYAGLGENIEWARKQQAVISARNQQGAEVKGFAALMRAYLSYNQARDGFRVVLLAEQFLVSFPESTMIPTVNRILFESRDSVEAWYAGILQQIDQLKAEKKYTEALQLIEGLPLQEMPPDRKAQLKTLVDELTTVQFQEAEVQRTTLEGGLQETWDKGQNHFQAKEYDQAIAVFSGLLTTSYADRAQSQINEVADLAAQEDRRKAAELFVQAGEAKGQETRTSLLLQSRQLLQDILRKYPQSDLVDKVRKNLEKIEQDLRAIDPGLLTTPPPADNMESGGQLTAPLRNGDPMNVGELQVQHAPAGGPTEQLGTQGETNIAPGNRVRE